MRSCLIYLRISVSITAYCRVWNYHGVFCSGAKHLPVENNTLIHFDSHPDMLIPQDLTSEESLDKYKLFEKLSIENWILPGVYMGVLRTIVWVCPWWCSQIQPGEYSFQVGRNKKTDLLSVTCLESYYISEGLFTTIDNLDRAREVKLLVIRLPEGGGDDGGRDLRDQILSVEEQLAEVDHYILDFDLDFFSTLNPFISLYHEAGLYQKLKALYSLSPVPASLETAAKIELAVRATEERLELLDNLSSIFSFLDSEENLELYEGPGEALIGPVTDIVQSVRKHYPRQEVDWRMVHDAGCTFDDSELPHHISSNAEINSLLRTCEQFLDILGKVPTIVTISRSSCDDYCPPHQVEDIQSGVLNLLKMKYGTITEHHCYK